MSVQGVQFTEASAKRIANVVRAVERSGVNLTAQRMGPKDGFQTTEFQFDVDFIIVDGETHVKCSSGYAAAYLNGSKTTDRHYADADDLGAYVEGGHVYIKYTHRAKNGTSATLGDLTYGTIPANTKEYHYERIALTKTVDGAKKIIQYIFERIDLQDAHRGQIVMHNTADAVPEFWQACDGTNGTPNMTDKFPRGGTDTDANDLHGGDDGGSTNNHDDHDTATIEVMTNVTGTWGGNSPVAMNITSEEITYMKPPVSGKHHSETSNVPEHTQLAFIMRM